MATKISKKKQSAATPKKRSETAPAADSPKLAQAAESSQAPHTAESGAAHKAGSEAAVSRSQARSSAAKNGSKNTGTKSRAQGSEDKAKGRTQEAADAGKSGGSKRLSGAEAPVTPTKETKAAAQKKPAHGAKRAAADENGTRAQDKAESENADQPKRPARRIAQLGGTQLVSPSESRAGERPQVSAAKSRAKQEKTPAPSASKSPPAPKGKQAAAADRSPAKAKRAGDGAHSKTESAATSGRASGESPRAPRGAGKSAVEPFVSPGVEPSISNSPFADEPEAEEIAPSVGKPSIQSAGHATTKEKVSRSKRKAADTQLSHAALAEPAPEASAAAGDEEAADDTANVNPVDPALDEEQWAEDGEEAIASALLADKETLPVEDEPKLSEEEQNHRHLKGLIEALLFSAEKPLSMRELARAARLDKKRTTELLKEVTRDYRHRGMTVVEIAGGYGFRSNPAYAPFVTKLLSLRPVRLSRAQLETLAVIAYRQPVTRPEVDDVRGVDSGQVIKGLLDRDLIKMLGKKDEVGRPMLYGTTPAFLELFSLESLKDLPNLREFTELSDDSREKYRDAMGETAPGDNALASEAAEAAVGDLPDDAEGSEPSESDEAVNVSVEAAADGTAGADNADREAVEAGDDADDRVNAADAEGGAEAELDAANAGESEADGEAEAEVDAADAEGEADAELDTANAYESGDEAEAEVDASNAHESERDDEADKAEAVDTGDDADAEVGVEAGEADSDEDEDGTLPDVKATNSAESESDSARATAVQGSDVDSDPSEDSLDDGEPSGSHLDGEE